MWKPVTRQGNLFTVVPANADPSELYQYTLDHVSPEIPPMSGDDRLKMLQFQQDTREKLYRQPEVQPVWLGDSTFSLY